MGLLSGLLSAGGAVVGGMVGGPAGAKIGASLGGAVGGAISSSKGSKKATEAQLAAIREARQIQGQAKDEALGYQTRYLDFGNQSMNALSGRLGLTRPAAQGGNALTMGGYGQADASMGGPLAKAGAVNGADPAAAMDWSGASGAVETMGPGVGGQPDFAAYGAANPDVQAEWGRIQQTGNAEAFGNDPNAYYEWHANTYGRGEGRDVPMSGGQPAPEAPVSSNALTGGPTADPGTFGSTDNPTAPERFQREGAPGVYQRPASFSFDANKAINSPILQAALKRGSQEVQSSAAAGGHLQSGATLKALQDRAMETTYRFLNDERSFDAGRYDKDMQFDYGQSRDARSDYVDDRGFDYGQNRDDRRDYEADRGYLTGRFDRGTDDLFRGVAVGQGAAGVASSAASRYGDQVAGLVTDAGTVKANNALTQGVIGSELAGSIAGTIAGAIPGVSKNALTYQPRQTTSYGRS